MSRTVWNQTLFENASTRYRSEDLELDFELIVHENGDAKIIVHTVVVPNAMGRSRAELMAICDESLNNRMSELRGDA